MGKSKYRKGGRGYGGLHVPMERGVEIARSQCRDRVKISADAGSLR